MEKTRILFLVPYPIHKAPSQRFRVELFLPCLNLDFDYTVHSFLDERTWSILYKNGHILSKVAGVVKGFLRRLKMVFVDVHKYDYIFIHREASPLGPPFIEWIIAKVWRKKILYDYDDAIWIPFSHSKIINWIKAYWKVKFICKWAYKVIGGNEYLCNYALQYNKQVILIPTCVDTVNRHNRIKDQNTNEIVIGWTGSHSTMNYLTSIVPVLRRISEECNVRLLIISNEPPSFNLPGMVFIPWKEKTEIEDLLRLNIGIMPLQNDEWSEGKCGFKIIQYLSLGIPAVASPVGVNKSIIENGNNGFLCSNENDWYNSLKILISDWQLRHQMGDKGRKKIENNYSVLSKEDLFLSLFK